MKIISDIGIQIPQVYLPKAGTDLNKWAVIACDQFTSEPEYWHEVEKIVGDAPSTLNLTFPEVYLEKPGEEERIQSIQVTMRKYMDEGILQPRDGLIYVERTVGGKTRKGVILCLDLERYDYNKGSSSLIRATEGTIVDRLPPRIKIRQGAAMELPHILVLIDDPNRTVIEPLSAAKSKLEKFYDFDLMLDSGHLAGYAVSAEFENQVVEALRDLPSPKPSRRNMASARTNLFCSLQWATAITRLQLPKPFGKRSSRRLAWIILRAMRWLKLKMSTMKGWSLSQFIACCLV